MLDFDAADNCRLFAATIKSKNLQEVVPSFPNEKFIKHFVLVLDLTSMLDGIEICHNLELVGKPLRKELNFIFPVRHIPQLIVLGKRMSSVAGDKFGVVGKNI